MIANLIATAVIAASVISPAPVNMGACITTEAFDLQNNQYCQWTDAVPLNSHKAERQDYRLNHGIVKIVKGKMTVVWDVKVVFTYTYPNRMTTFEFINRIATLSKTVVIPKHK